MSTEASRYVVRRRGLSLKRRRRWLFFSIRGSQCRMTGGDRDRNGAQSQQADTA